ncbi:MAG: TlpA disulfide reductase family protein [Gemmatimonadaceae bacterium]
MNEQFSAIFQNRKFATTAFALGMMFGAAQASAQDGGLAVGTKAPAAAVQMMDGSAADLSQFYGKKPVVMEFWATWCPLCKAMEPQFKVSQAKHGDKVMFVNVGVPTNQTREREQQYITANSLGGTFVFDSAGNAMSAYKVPHTSHILVIDTKGMIVYNGVGKSQDLEAAIDKAMMMKH